MKKIINSIFFISCTSIGAGILALPCLTVYNGFSYSLIVFFICYFFMTISALLLLEVTLWFKKNTNIISMVNQILGYKWKITVSIVYILLLYSLISAYILAYTQWLLSKKTTQIVNNIFSIPIYIIIIIFITFYKEKTLNKINNILSIFLFITYLIIILQCSKYVNIENVLINNIKNLSTIFTIAVTSFGFGIIIPTLSNFLKKDYLKLYKSLIIGSLIPLIVYVLWILIMIGIFPLDSDYNLKNINLQKINADFIFINFVENIINSKSISVIIKLFALLSIVTSLIGVSASLRDFLSDERILKKHTILTFITIIIPPILILTYFNFGFINILKISGILVSFLLGIIPVSIAWYGRYNLKIFSKVIVPGGKPILLFTYLFFIYIILNDICL